MTDTARPQRRLDVGMDLGCLMGTDPNHGRSGVSHMRSG